MIIPFWISWEPFWSFWISNWLHHQKFLFFLLSVICLEALNFSELSPFNSLEILFWNDHLSAIFFKLKSFIIDFNSLAFFWKYCCAMSDDLNFSSIIIWFLDQRFCLIMGAMLLGWCLSISMNTKQLLFFIFFKTLLGTTKSISYSFSNGSYKRHFS